MAGNAYTIDKHPKKKMIVRDILKGIPDNAIANNYDLSVSSVKRYRNGKLMKLCAQVVAEDKNDAQGLLDRIEPVIDKVERLYEAFDEWLRDPDDKTKYFIGPRAEEVMVVSTHMETNDNGREYTVRSKHTLSYWVAEIEGNGEDVTSLQWNSQDPRALMLKTAETLTKQMVFLAKLQGLVKETVVVKNEPDRVMQAVCDVILNVIPDVETKRKVLDAIKELKDPESVEL